MLRVRSTLAETQHEHCDCEVTETAALHVPGRTIRQRMKDCRGHSSGSGGMAGWQGGGSAGRQRADGSAWRAHPAAAPRHMSTRGVQRGGSGACRAGAVRALAQPGRPGGRGRGILWYRGGGGRVALGATARVPKGSASTKSMGSGGLVGGAAGCRRGHESQGRHAGSNGVRKCGGRIGKVRRVCGRSGGVVEHQST